MPVRLVVFDLDGTLIDSRRDLADSANEMLAGYGAPPIPEKEIGHMVGAGAQTLVARALKAANVDVPIGNALARFLTSYDRRLTTHTRPYPGIPELLDTLQAEGLKLALLTNKPLEQSIAILEMFRLAKHFRLRVGGDGAWPRKPSPEGLQYLMRQESEEPETTLLVGDSTVDLQTASHAGVRLCLARYGFGFADIASDALSGDELIVDSPHEIADAVRR